MASQKRYLRRSREPFTVTRYRGPKGYYVAGSQLSKWERKKFREDWTYRRTEGGSFAEAVRRTYPQISIRKYTVPGVIEEKGPNQGLIRHSLGETNILTESKRATRVEIRIQGKDRRKHVRLTGSLDLDIASVKQHEKFQDLILMKSLKMLQERGFRTQYPLTVITGRGMTARRAEAARRRVLRAVRLIVTVFKSP